MKRLIGSTTIAFLTSSALAGPTFETGYSTYGMPGLVDMPSAKSLPDAEIGVTVSRFGGQTRTTGAFQITPRLTGAFRYSVIDNFNGGGTLYDRSFALQYRLFDEHGLRPAIALGINDLIGTGVYASEYVVATKQVTPRLRFSGGIGWGRLGQVGGFTNPLGAINDNFETRGARDFGKGGEPEIDQFFRGDAAFFGGLEFRATERLSFALEYSSDDYSIEDGPTFDYRSPWNYGLTYRLRDGVDLSAQYLYGSEVGVQLTFALNPREPRFYGGGDPAPYPVTPRREVDAAALGWTLPDSGRAATSQLSAVLESDGIGLHGLILLGNRARVEIENRRYYTTAQAVGRTARILTATLPPEVDTFEIVPVIRGLAASEVTIRRGDMESLAFDLDNSWKSYARAEIEAGAAMTAPLPGIYPRLDFGLAPYLEPNLFDPDDPVRADFGIELYGEAEPAPGLVFQGAVRQKVVGNLDESTRASDSVLPRVRSETNLYQKAGETALTHLTGAYFFKPGADLYGRVTAGYLEPQFGGLSAEVLWKPVDSDFAFGVEANYVKQREFEQGFGFRDYEVATGHASFYYDFDNGFEAQLDAGRYLAGDWGATFALNRTFDNGWKLGAFATLTDVPFDEFGEGSFDKGIRVTIPIDWVRGTPTRSRFAYTLRPLERDGGARLRVRDRLYDRVREAHRPDLQDSWGRFWK